MEIALENGHIVVQSTSMLFFRVNLNYPEGGFIFRFACTYGLVLYENRSHVEVAQVCIDGLFHNFGKSDCLHYCDVPVCVMLKIKTMSENSNGTLISQNLLHTAFNVYYIGENQSLNGLSQ